MTDAQILKSLELCTGPKPACDECMYNGGVGDLSCVGALLEDVHKLLRKMADAGTLIHCVDCKHCEPIGVNDGWYCSQWGHDLYQPAYNPEMFYCADAERR